MVSSFVPRVKQLKPKFRAHALGRDSRNSNHLPSVRLAGDDGYCGTRNIQQLGKKFNTGFVCTPVDWRRCKRNLDCAIEVSEDGVLPCSRLNFHREGNAQRCFLQGDHVVLVVYRIGPFSSNVFRKRNTPRTCGQAQMRRLWRTTTASARRGSRRSVCGEFQWRALNSRDHGVARRRSRPIAGRLLGMRQSWGFAAFNLEQTRTKKMIRPVNSPGCVETPSIAICPLKMKALGTGTKGGERRGLLYLFLRL